LALALAAASASAAAPSAYAVVDRIRGPDGGWDFLRIDKVNRRLLLTRATSVMAVDLATGAVSTGLAEGQRLHDVVPVNEGAELLVTQGGANAAVFVDAKTGRQIATIPTGEHPDAAAYDPGTGVVLVMNNAQGDITVIDARDHRRTGSIEVGGALEMAALDGAGRAFVNIEDRNEIAVVDIGRRKVVGRYKLPGCDGPTGIAYDPVRRWLVAACDGSTDVLDARSGALVRTLKTGEDADGVAIDLDHRVAFVPGREGSLSVISLAGSKPSLAEVLRIQPGARTLAVDPDSGRVYLPTAKYEPAVAGQRPRQVPGSFEILVVGRVQP
jgi:DNA-binding beta-propeller fold protein YncE